MNTRFRRGATHTASIGLVLMLTPASAGAAGFAIFEQGARGMGFAGAYTAQTKDASALFHNAAGIAFLKGNQLLVGGTLIAPSTDFTGASPFPGASVTEKGDAGIVVPPTLDFTHQLSSRLAVGLGVHVPYGLRTRWANRDTTYTGRFLSKSAQIQGFSINPTIAYKLADRLAVGAGFDFRLASVHLQKNAGIINPFTQKVEDVAAIDLTSDTNTGMGFNVGLLAKPTENFAVGVAYRHKVKIDFTGSADFTLIPTGNTQIDGVVKLSLPSGAEPVTSQIEFPSLVSVGASYERGNWTFAGQIDFHQWSSFDQLPVTFERWPSLSQVIPEDYKNTMIFRVGMERVMGEHWALRGGYFYDQTPSPAASVSPLLPDADRHGIAAGFTYQRGRFHVDVANWYLIFKKRSTEGQNRDNYNGTYESAAELFAVTLGFRF
jgi:long-chain fatty acid transport protein